MSAKAIGLLGAAISKLGGLLRRRLRPSQEARLRRAVVDELEQRRLLSCSISSGVVTCNGTSGMDGIRVYQINGVSFNTIYIDINGSDPDWNYDTANVTRVDIFAGDDDDTITVEGSDTGIVFGQHAVSETVVIYGEDGNDSVYGGDGSESMYGGNGIDSLTGYDGADFIYGESGNDEFHGGDGNDWMYGGGDEDELFGESGNDHLNGGDANDVLWGGADNDELNGDAGDDDLDGQAGSDTLAGGAGGDTLEGRDSAGGDTLDGGSDTDTLLGSDVGDTVLNIP